MWISLHILLNSLHPNSIWGSNSPTRSVPGYKRLKTSSRILTARPSTTPFWPRLRYRLTRRGRTSRRKPWVFGVPDSHRDSALLIPAFSLRTTPPILADRLHCGTNAPLPYLFKEQASLASVHNLSSINFRRLFPID